MSNVQGTDCRKLTPDEILQLVSLQSFVFQFIPDEAKIREKIGSGKLSGDVTYGAVDQNGRVLAGMKVYPYSMWFDGHVVPMRGIAGVASAPEYRRRGNIRRIFAKVLEDAYESGAVFSHLYPFSFEYYRKFGYEHCGAAKRYTLPVAPARGFRQTGAAHAFAADDPARGRLIEVYEAFASRHNLMLSRAETGWEQEGWDKVLDVPLFGTHRVYYWTDASGAVKSWARFRKDGGELRISDLVWTDQESMLGILQFLGMFDGAAEKLVLTASPELVPELYWNEAYAGVAYDWLGMSRVVNVRRALELMRKPGGEGRFSVRVLDDFAGWNSGVYEVEYGGGECAVKVSEKALGADVEVPERALVQMILGVYGFEQTSRKSDVSVNGNARTLEKVFCGKNVLITDHF